MPPPPPEFPSPLTYPPLRPPHRQTFILNGCGSTAQEFAPVLLAHPIPDASDVPASPPQTLRTLFLYAAFVFPTGSRRRVARCNRAYTPQWFDVWSLENPNTRPHHQPAGLRDTSKLVWSLVREAAAEVGSKNVVFGGLSQGCAAALVVMLSANKDEIGVLAGFVGMCGWLPLQ